MSAPLTSSVLRFLRCCSSSLRTVTNCTIRVMPYILPRFSSAPHSTPAYSRCLLAVQGPLVPVPRFVCPSSGRPSPSPCPHPRHAARPLYPARRLRPAEQNSPICETELATHGLQPHASMVLGVGVAYAYFRCSTCGRADRLPGVESLL